MGEVNKKMATNTAGITFERFKLFFDISFTSNPQIIDIIILINKPKSTFGHKFS